MKKRILLFNAVIMFILLTIVATSCKKECPQPDPVPAYQQTRHDSLTGVWIKAETQEWRSDTLYRTDEATADCPLTLSSNGQAVDAFTYCSPHSTSWTMVNNEQICIDSVITTTTSFTLPIGNYDIDQLDAHTLILKQHYSFPGFRIRFVFVR